MFHRISSLDSLSDSDTTPLDSSSSDRSTPGLPSFVDLAIAITQCRKPGREIEKAFENEDTRHSTQKKGKNTTAISAPSHNKACFSLDISPGQWIDEIPHISMEEKRQVRKINRSQLVSLLY